jgi:hypothetical protein
VQGRRLQRGTVTSATLSCATGNNARSPTKWQNAGRRRSVCLASATAS